MKEEVKSPDEENKSDPQENVPSINETDLNEVLSSNAVVEERNG